MRLLAIDHGQVRIGLAISDPTGTLATPLGVHVRRRKRKQDLAALSELARQERAEAFVIGIPLDLDGSAGKKAREVQQFADALREVSGMSVHEWDERFSTVMAEEKMHDMSFKRRKKRAVVDAVAAAVILQGFLDSPEAMQRARESSND